VDDSTRQTLSRLEPSLPSRSYFDPERFLFQSMGILIEQDHPHPRTLP